MNNILKIHSMDNVVVALSDIKKNSTIKVDGKEIKVLEDIPKAHKIAIENIPANNDIIKYSMPIGSATDNIKIGQLVHTHNVKTKLNENIKYTYTPVLNSITDIEKNKKDLKVYHRFNGEIAIRNELWIIPTVGCVNQTSKQIVETFKNNNPSFEKHIDGVFSFSHPYGCSQMGDDLKNTKKSLQNIAKHPNAGGVLVLGLGCENNQISEFKSSLGEYNKERIKFLVSQDTGNEIEEGVKILNELYEIMKNDKRSYAPLSKLKIGLECGGSDGFSGITANPLLGRFSDYIIKHGAASVLTEVPEMFGAEKILMNRCSTKDIFIKTVNLINDFKDYYRKHNQVIYDNPSPGNKKGGITTLEDKSLGCIEKGGQSKIVDVLKLNERISKPGLNLLESPGNDLIATTALGQSGCHMVLFTTGRGTPFGGFVPTLKISTNSDLANKKSHWIDFDAGKLIGKKTMDELLEEFIDLVIDTANGKKTKNEINDFREIAIFKSGVTL